MELEGFLKVRLGVFLCHPSILFTDFLGDLFDDGFIPSKLACFLVFLSSWLRAVLGSEGQ